MRAYETFAQEQIIEHNLQIQWVEWVVQVVHRHRILQLELGDRDVDRIAHLRVAFAPPP